MKFSALLMSTSILMGLISKAITLDCTSCDIAGLCNPSGCDVSKVACMKCSFLGCVPAGCDSSKVTCTACDPLGSCSPAGCDISKVPCASCGLFNICNPLGCSSSIASVACTSCDSSGFCSPPGCFSTTTAPTTTTSTLAMTTTPAIMSTSATTTSPTTASGSVTGPSTSSSSGLISYTVCNKTYTMAATYPKAKINDWKNGLIAFNKTCRNINPNNDQVLDKSRQKDKVLSGYYWGK